MITIRATYPSGAVVDDTVQDLTRFFANKTCQAYGWEIGSPAHRDLSAPDSVSTDFLLDQARQLHPGATVTVVEIPDPLTPFQEALATIERFNRDHGGDPRRDCLLVANLRALEHSAEVIAGILEVIEATCQHCWDAPTGCRCHVD